MLAYAVKATIFLGHVDTAELEANEEKLMAIVGAVQVIGEAASKLSPSTKASLPGMPWREIVRMRNLLVHNYFEIDVDVLVDTIRNDLPSLIAHLERRLAEKDTTP